MGAVSYTIKAFDPEEAASGALCIVTSKSFNEGNSITPDATWSEIVTVDGQTKTITHNTVVGTGICRRSGNQFVITIGSTNYLFKTDGNGYSVNAKDKYIYLCEVNDTTQVEGNTTVVTQYVSIDADGKITRGSIAPNADKGYSLDELNARDEFAAQALRGILARIDNPSVLSENEIQFYCEAAYKWADKMILETAKRRVLGVGTNSGGGEGGGDNITVNNTYTTSEDLLKKIAENIEHLDISVEAGDTTVDIDTDGLIKALTGKDNKTDVHSGDDVASKLDYIVRGLIGKGVNDRDIAEFKSLLESLDTMSDPQRGVPLRNSITEDRDDIPLKVQMETGTLAIENVVEQGTSNPFIVSSTVSNVKVQKQGRLVTDAFMVGGDLGLTIGDDEGNPIYVENTGAVTLKNDSDNGTDIPLKVENSGELEVSIKNSTTGGNPTPLAVSTDIQDELNEIKESIDNLIDWEKAYETGTVTISTQGGLFNLRPLPDNILKMRLRISDGNGDKVEISPDAVVTYQWFNDNTSVTDLEGINFKDIISALRDKPSGTVTHLQIGSQRINSAQYATPIKIVVDYVYGNTGSNSTNRTISGDLSIKNSSTTDGNNTVAVPLEVNASVTGVDNIPWVLYRKTQYNTTLDCFVMPTVNGEPTIADPKYLKLEIVRVVQGQITKADSDVECTVNMYDRDGNAAQSSDVSYPLNYIPYLIRSTAIGPDLMTLRITSANRFPLDGTCTLYVYAAGNASSVNVSGGSGGGSTDVSSIVTALNNLTGSKTKDRTISAIPSLSGNFNVSEQNRNRSVSFTSGTSLNVSIPNTVRTDTDSLVNGCIIFGNNDNYGIEPRGTGGYCHIGLDDKRFNEIFGDTITCDVLYVGDRDQNSQTYFNVNQTGQVKATKYEVAGGTAAGFLKADGSIDTSYYIKEDSNKDVYLRKDLYLGTNNKIAFGINNEYITCGDSLQIPYNGFVMHNGMLSLKYPGTNAHYSRQWLTESSVGLVHHFGSYNERGDSEIAYMKYDFEGDVRIQNKKLYIIDSNVNSTFSIGDFANDGTVTFKNDANDFKFEGSVYSYNELLTSDITLKDVLSEEEFEVSKLAEMPLVKFTWKDEKKDKKVHFGSIAQEWEKILPEVVSKGSDDKLYLDYNGASMAAGVTACREIVKMKEEMEALKKENEYLKKELEAIKEIVYGKEKDDMED